MVIGGVNGKTLNEHHLCFTGIHSSDSHTSKIQLATFKQTMDTFCKTFNDLQSLGRESAATGHTRPLETSDLICKATGMNSDHAEDQKKLNCLLQEWKGNAWIEYLGLEVLAALSHEAVAQILQDELEAMLAAAGSFEQWDALLDDERKEHQNYVHMATVQKLSKSAYLNLPSKDRSHIDLWAWAGCAMHKEMKLFQVWKHRNEGQMDKAWCTTSNSPNEQG